MDATIIIITTITTTTAVTTTEVDHINAVATATAAAATAAMMQAEAAVPRRLPWAALTTPILWCTPTLWTYTPRHPQGHMEEEGMPT